MIVRSSTTDPHTVPFHSISYRKGNDTEGYLGDKVIVAIFVTEKIKHTNTLDTCSTTSLFV